MASRAQKIDGVLPCSVKEFRDRPAVRTSVFINGQGAPLSVSWLSRILDTCADYRVFLFGEGRGFHTRDRHTRLRGRILSPPFVLGRHRGRLYFAYSPPYLDYSRVEIAVDARRKGCSCSCLPQILCNEADAAKSARL